MGNIETKNGIPLYEQVYSALCRDIDLGIYKSGEQIPAEGYLCEKFHVSRVTVRKALQKMVDKKILVKRHGIGTFVSSPFVESTLAQNSFTRSCEQMNAVPSTKVISVEQEKAACWLAEQLGVKENAKVICVKRVRMANEIPVIFEKDYFSEEHEYILNVDMENVPVRESIVKNTGYEVQRYQDTFDVHFADKEEGEWLLCPAHTALLGVSQFVYGENDKVLYYNEQYIRSDIYKYVTGR